MINAPLFRRQCLHQRRSEVRCQGVFPGVSQRVVH